MAIPFYLELLCYYSPLPQLYGVPLWLSMVRMEMCCNFGTNWAKRRSQVKIQCCEMSQKRSRFVFLLLNLVDLFVLELQVGEKMTENTVNSRLANTSL